MRLTKRDTPGLLASFPDDFMQMFGARPLRWLGDNGEETGGFAWTPNVDIKEESDRFLVRADVPGVDPKDIEVTLDKGILTIRGERKEEKKDEHEGYRSVGLAASRRRRLGSGFAALDGCAVGAFPSGDVVPLRVAARLDGLEPGEVRVECVVVANHVHGRRTWHFPFKAGSDAGKEHLFELDLVPPAERQLEIRVRAYPTYAALSHPIAAGHPTWLS
jgi:HSP20 family molecular chaperone IbpA